MLGSSDPQEIAKISILQGYQVHSFLCRSVFESPRQDLARKNVVIAVAVASVAVAVAVAVVVVVVLRMDEILHRLSYVSHPFQTLNLEIGLLTTLRRGMCAKDRNPASPTHSGTVEIRGVSAVTYLSGWGSCRILSIHRSSRSCSRSCSRSSSSSSSSSRSRSRSRGGGGSSSSSMSSITQFALVAGGNGSCACGCDASVHQWNCCRLCAMVLWDVPDITALATTTTTTTPTTAATATASLTSITAITTAATATTTTVATATPSSVLTAAATAISVSALLLPNTDYKLLMARLLVLRPRLLLPVAGLFLFLLLHYVCYFARS